MVFFIVEMDIYPCSSFFLWSPDKENINLPKQKKNVILHTKDRKNHCCVVKGLSDARIKVDARTKYDVGMAQLMIWHED